MDCDCSKCPECLEDMERMRDLIREAVASGELTEEQVLGVLLRGAESN